MNAIESVYSVKLSLNPKSKQWTTGDSGKFEHTDYSEKNDVRVFEVLL